MKKIFRNTMWVALGAIALTACSTDNTEELQPAGANPDNSGEGRTLTVVASLSDETKAAFNDGESIKWAVGDQIKWSNEATTIVSAELAAENLDETGTVAQFKFTGLTTGADGWFFSTTNHPNNSHEVEFTLGDSKNASFTQDQAGVMNARYLFLHSGAGTMKIPENAETISLKMEIAGSIFRILPYTTSETYASEKITKVSLSSNSDLVGTVRYWRVKDGASHIEYEDVTDTSWAKSKQIAVTLGTSFSLEGVASRDKSKGIYMAVASTTAERPLDGYKYVVYTDKATYTFDAMDKKLEVKDNAVKNVFLDLAKATKRIGNDEKRGELRYHGNVDEYNKLKFTSDAQTTLGEYGFWWAAQIREEGEADWQTQEANVPDNQIFYKNATFNAKNADGSEATWVRCGYNTNDTVWKIEMDENTSTEERTATITATFADAGGYVVTDECRTKTITITQLGKITATATINKLHTEVIPNTGATIAQAAKLTLTIDGMESKTVKTDLEKHAISLVCENATSVVCDEDGYIAIVFPENKPNLQKTYTLQVILTGKILATAEFYQQAGTRTPGAFGYTMTGWQNGMPNRPLDFTAAETENVTEWLAVISNISKNGDVAYNGRELSADEEKALIMQVLDWTEEDWNNTFLKFHVDYGVGETKICVGVKANTTGAARTATGKVWTSDWGKVVTNWTVNQAAQ